jgi:hypothetical protein
MKIALRISSATVSIESASTHATKILAVKAPSAFLKIMDLLVNVPVDTSETHTLNVHKSKDVDQIVSVLALKLAWMANVRLLVNVESMPSALSKIIKLLANALKVTLETPQKVVDLLPTLVNPIHVALMLFANLIMETQFAIARKEWLEIHSSFAFLKVVNARRTLAVPTVAAESLKENQNVSVFPDLKEIHHVSLVVLQKAHATLLHAVQTRNAQSPMESPSAHAFLVSLKVQIPSEVVSSLLTHVIQILVETVPCVTRQETQSAIVQEDQLEIHSANALNLFLSKNCANPAHVEETLIASLFKTVSNVTADQDSLAILTMVAMSHPSLFASPILVVPMLNVSFHLMAKACAHVLKVWEETQPVFKDVMDMNVKWTMSVMPLKPA